MDTDTARRMREQVERVAAEWEARARAASVLREYEGTHDVLSDLDASERERVEHARGVLDADNFGDPANHAADGLDDALDALSEDALEVYVTGRRSVGDSEWAAEGAVVVLGTGGPHMQLEYDGRNVAAHGWDWLGEGRTRVELAPDAAALVERVFALDLLLD